jgi:hypothetical protein
MIKTGWLASIALLMILAGVVIGSGIAALNRTEYANGWDGYYYLVQVQSINNTGSMHSPEYSPVYLPLIALYAITGNYITSYKLSAVIIKVLFVFSVFTLGFSLLRSKPDIDRRTAFFTALIAGALSSMSPSLNYFFTQFPKNLLGFALLFFFMASVYGTSRVWKEQKSPSSHQDIPERGSFARMLRVLGVLLLLLATFFTHRFAAVLSICFLVLYFAPSAKHRLQYLWSVKKREPDISATSWLQKHRKKSLRLFILLIPFMALLALSHKLPLALSFYDMEIITGDFSLKPIFVPASFMQNFGTFRFSTAWIAEIFLASTLPLITCALLLSRHRFSFLRLGREYYIPILFSLTGLFPFFRFSLTGLSYRLYYGTLLIFPLLCIPYICSGVKKILTFRPEKKSVWQEAIPVLLFVALLASSLHTGRSYNPELHDPPYEFYEELAAECVASLADVDCELIIAHKPLAAVITYNFEVDALPWSPEEYFPRERVWRITAGILQDEVAMYLSPELAEQHFMPLTGDYALMREDHWEAFMRSIANDPVMLEAVHTWRNPYEQRPGYMMKGK